MNRSAFVHLVKQDARWNIVVKKELRWGLIYGLAGLILGVIFYTYAVLQGHMKPQDSMFFGYGLPLPYITMPIAFSLIVKEWKNRTYGWWLSLPYSRVWLVLCKGFATLLQVLKIYLLYVLGILVFSLYGMILTGDYAMAPFFALIVGAFQYWLFLLVIFPLHASLGLLAGIIAKTKFKPLMPLLWIVMFLSINFMFIPLLLNIGFESRWFGQDANSLAAFHLPAVLIPVFVANLILGWILIQISAKMLSKHLSV